MAKRDMKAQLQESTAKHTKGEALSFHLIEPNNREIPILEERKISGKNYLFYGHDNDFPQYLWNLYLNSAIMQGIVNGTIDYVSGNEVVSELMEINKEGDTITDLIRKITTDYMVYGGFAVQILRDFNGNISELYWLDVKELRMDSNEKFVYFSKEWNKYGSKAVKYELFNPLEKQSNSIFYYKGHLSRGVYPVPRYIGALAAIETSTEIGKFHLRNILNNLSSSALINFNNGVPSASDQKEIEKKVREKFTGADNAGKFILSFNDNKESAATIERLAEDKMDEKFNTLKKSVTDEIFIAFRAQPALFGMRMENTGFSLVEFEESFNLYNKTVVIPIQNDIKRCFTKIYGREIIDFVPFKLDTNTNGNISNQ